ncbi:uncharacterized protein LOC129761325 [Toxorhynchites rutilus septentrionalis]|uniref:uncharacterized protein LOC129761325 n=1 Tax=Toxorhynchites rutilus septentrionalis TaxID=329112 RepID=UPI00247AEF3E|nr:uncharacterized protein LOC129761325 [Toxorhynchites rutilus septentrionalis]
MDEWRHIPSKLNVADEATKWGSGPNFEPSCRWFQGPAFLSDPETQWPKESKNIPLETREELREVVLHHSSVVVGIIDVERFSNWNRLLRAMAYVFKVASLAKKVNRDSGTGLSRDELMKAEVTLWREAQTQAYLNEVECLRKRAALGKSSSLYPLIPFLDESNVIRVGGRIGAAPLVPYSAKYPIILPKAHRITMLIIDSYHRKFLHANTETVCNEIKQQFYIQSLRTLVRKVSRSCQMCKIRKAVPTPPLMSPLPEVRLTPFTRPFTYVGVDYFGPLEVTVGRSVVKRWVCLFTCLTIRAVHLEVCHSLSTNSCVMAFRRFVARRGAPLEVYSDNGTNFVGASRQLSDELLIRIRKINENCASTFTNAHTKWYFNVPAAPHMGGPWERMVRSVEVAMKAITESSRHPSDEVLETILTNGIKQPVTSPVDGTGALRDSWKLAQHMVDGFWRRWIHEYLPMLTRRTKWFERVKPLEPGDVVIVVDENTRNRWERGRILETFPDKDGQVRRARIQTARGVFSRPAVKLAVLDVARPRSRTEGISETEVDHGSEGVTDPTVHRDV